MNNADLKPGLRFKQTITVDENLIVPSVAKAFTGFTDMPPVFATAFLVGFAEWTCIEALRPYLPADARTVGVHVDLSHSAATPIGLQVTADVELVAIEDRKLRFKVVCTDDTEVISEGYHDRFIVQYEKFIDRVNKKRDKALTLRPRSGQV